MEATLHELAAQQIMLGRYVKHTSQRALTRAGAPSEGDLADVRRAPFARSAFGRAAERRLARANVIDELRERVGRIEDVLELGRR